MSYGPVGVTGKWAEDSRTEPRIHKVDGDIKGVFIFVPSVSPW